MSMTRPVFVKDLNASEVTSIWYWPTDKTGNVNTPSWSAVVISLTPVCVLVTTTVAPGITDPVWSLTAPVILPPTSARAADATRTTTINNNKILPFALCMILSLDLFENW